MSENKAYIVPNHNGPTVAVSIDSELCIACNLCADICRIQTILPNPQKGKPPVVVYPDECWYCGCCVEACPTGALQMRLPINQRIFFKDKDTNEIFRIGGTEAPPKSYFRPPFGWMEGESMEGVWHALEESSGKYPVAFVSQQACAETAKRFKESPGTDCRGKIAALLHAIGFKKVYLADKPFDVICENACTVYFGSDKPGTDFDLDSRNVADMINRGCVSHFTAVQTWKTIKEEEFDKP